MALDHETVQVQVGQGSLWIGSEVYPLRQIARVGTRQLVANRANAWKEFIVRAVLVVIVGLIVTVGSEPAGIAIILIGLALLIWRLVNKLNVPAVYGLVLNTAGTDRAAVWSTDEDQIDKLVRQLTEAIANPDMPTKTTNIYNVVNDGDVNQVFGGIKSENAKVGR